MSSNTPIDIVYLWVDGNDPVWRKKRQRAAAALCPTALAMHGNVEGRFRDNDELRYSLRALERFFPGHGHVYIVTDAQRPDWLKPSAGLTVIDHQQLIASTALPTFDSGHIESYIHRIKGLSERFFYLNDDVFFGAPVRVEDWFSDSGIYEAWSDEPLRPDGNALENACRASTLWLRASAAANSTGQLRATAAANSTEQLRAIGVAKAAAGLRTFAHAPRPLLKSLIFELERLAPEVFERTRSTVFRVWDKPPVISDLLLRWALSRGIVAMRAYEQLHLDTGNADPFNCLEQLKTEFGQLDFFCINDTTDDAHAHDPRLLRVRLALQQLLPEPSCFERQRVEMLPRQHATQPSLRQLQPA